MWFSSSWKIHFFLKASFVLDDVEIKNTSCFIQNMFDLNYNKLLCSQTSESHVLNKPYIMLKFPWSCRNMRGKEEEDDFGSCSQYTEAELSFAYMVLLRRKTYVFNVTRVYCKHKLIQRSLLLADVTTEQGTGSRQGARVYLPQYAYMFWYILKSFNCWALVVPLATPQNIARSSK